MKENEQADDNLLIDILTQWEESLYRCLQLRLEQQKVQEELDALSTKSLQDLEHRPDLQESIKHLVSYKGYADYRTLKESENNQ